MQTRARRVGGGTPGQCIHPRAVIHAILHPNTLDYVVTIVPFRSCDASHGHKPYALFDSPKGGVLRLIVGARIGCIK